jgi:hypothetical protein
VVAFKSFGALAQCVGSAPIGLFGTRYALVGTVTPSGPLSAKEETNLMRTLVMVGLFTLSFLDIFWWIR